MKKGIEAESQKLGVQVDTLSSPSEGDVQAQLTLLEDLVNRNYKGIAFAPISPVNLIQPAAKAYRKGIFLVDLDEKADMKSLHQAGSNVTRCPSNALRSGRTSRNCPAVTSRRC